jgi:nucleotide-binding universal stress UspA family protein
MKTILICTDGSPFAETSYRYGAYVANRLKPQAAAIDVLCVTDICSKQVVFTGKFSGYIGIDDTENLLNHLVELEQENAKINHQRVRLILQAAVQTLKAEGINRINPIYKAGFLVDCLDEFEHEFDLIVLGKRGENASFASGHLGANLEKIVRGSRKPCLVTPLKYRPIERLLLAYDGSKTGQKMVEFIKESPLFQGLELHLVTVAKTLLDRPIMKKRLNQAANLLQEAQFDPVAHLMEGEPEKAIAHYIREKNISLLIMGAYGHSRIRHLVIGSTTAQMLRSSNIPVLLFR